MDPRASFPLAAVSRQWGSLPDEVTRLIKRFARPATPSAEAFKAAMTSGAPLLDSLPDEAWWGNDEDCCDSNVQTMLESPVATLRCSCSDRCRCFTPGVFLRWEIGDDGHVFRFRNMQQLDCRQPSKWSNCCGRAVDSRDWKTRGIVKEKLNRQDLQELDDQLEFALDYAQDYGDWAVIENFPLHLLDPPQKYVPGVGVVPLDWPRLQAPISDRPP